MSVSVGGNKMRRWVELLAVIALLLIIVWEVYLIALGGLIQSAKSSSEILLCLAFIGVLAAAWSVIDLEYFPKSSGLSRKTRVWLIIGTNLWCAGLLLLWLEPQLAVVIVIAFFAITDFLIFQAARDLFRRAFSAERS